MNQFQNYVKSLTLPVGGEAGQTRIEALQEFLIGSSLALNSLPKYTLSAKNNLLPVLDIPEDDSTSYTILGLNLLKDRDITSAILTDETKEDAVPNMWSAVDTCLVAQARLKLEKMLADKLLVQSLVTGFTANGASAETIIDLMAEFDESILSMPGDTITFVNPKTYLKLHNQMSTVQFKLLEGKVVPLYGLSETDIATVHTSGAGIGFEILDVENDREAESQKDVLVSAINFGFAVDPAYVKRISL